MEPSSVVSGEPSLLGIASSGCPPKESMAAKCMVLAVPGVEDDTFDLCKPSSHLSSDLPFATCVAAVPQVWRQFREEKSSLSRTKMKLKSPLLALLGVTVSLDISRGTSVVQRIDRNMKD